MREEIKMKKIEAYANYGVLAHEKQTLFSPLPLEKAVLSEKVNIFIPEEEVKILTKTEEDIFVQVPDGNMYPLWGLLSNYKDESALQWYDGRKNHRVLCQWEEA